MKEKDPPNQPWLGIIYRQEILDCHMIGVDDYLRIQKIGSEFFKDKYYHKQFLLCSCIIQLRSIKGFASIIYSMYLAIFSFSQHGSNDIVASIAHDLKWLTPIGWLNDRCIYQSSL
jgi:hypothetical protein